MPSRRQHHRRHDSTTAVPSYIIKPDRDEDFYVIWSSVTDSPHAFGDRAYLASLSWAECTPERFKRADRTGTSAMWPSKENPAYGWQDTEGFIYEQRGWLRHDQLNGDTWVAWGYAADGEETITVTADAPAVEPVTSATPMQMYELETRLGGARDELTDQQVEGILDAVHRHQNLPGYDAEDFETNEAVLTAIVQRTLGELDLAAAGQAYRRARLTAETYALGAVLAGMPEARAARESTLDRMTVRRILGKK